jgi:hypothetical protein
MASVVNIDGPDDNGNYKARLSDGNTMTFGRPADRRWRDPDRPDRYWFVSIDTGSNHTTFIVEASPDIGENEGMAQIRAIKARGSDVDMWRLYAVAVLNS